MQPKSTQAWLTMPCLGCWTNGRKKPFARITEQKREALIKCQQQLSPQCSAQYEKEPVGVRRAAERGVKRRWKKAGVNVGERWVTSLRWANGYLTCMNVSVVKRKKPSHKKGKLFLTLLNTSKLESHQTWGWVYPGHAFREITV